MKNTILNIVGKIEARKSFNNYQRRTKKGYYPVENDDFNLPYNNNEAKANDEIETEQMVNNVSSNCSNEATPVVKLRGSENDILIDNNTENAGINDEIKEQVTNTAQNESNSEELKTNEISNQVNSDDGDHVEATSTQIPRVDDEHKFDGYVHFDSLVEGNDNNENGESYVDLNGIAMSLGSAEGPYGGQELQDRINSYVNPTHRNHQNNETSQQSDTPRYDYSAYYSGMPTQPGYGRHKQDNQEVKQPKIEAKAKPDIIEGVDQTKDTVEGALNALGIEKREVKQDLAIFKDDQVIKDQEIPQENANQINYKQTIQAGNEELINKHWWLKEIQRIANENNCFVQFADFVDQNNNPIGIMSVRAFTERDNSYVSNPYKSFVIDYSGNFYDKRIKMFATTDGSYILDLSTITYNKLNAFSVTIDDRSNNKRNSEKINDKFFNCFFKSGSIMLIDSKDGMYSPKVRELNTYVNLASTPTKYMDKPDRSIARDRLIKAMEIKDPNSSPFASARTMDPYCRFNYYGFDKRSKVFMIENANTEIPIYIIFNNNGHSTIETNREKAISIYEAFKSEYYKKEKENSIKSYSNYKK